MAYSLTRLNDIYTLDTEQSTSVKLYYTSYGSKDVIEEKTVSGIYEVITKKDGDYILELTYLVEEIEQIEEENLYIYTYLRNSIVKDILGYKSCEKEVDCISLFKKQEILSKDKNLLNKILVYQNKYIYKINVSGFSKFYNFIQSAIELNNCNVQKSINNITNTERLGMTTIEDKSLFETFLFLYWAGFYFVDKNLLTDTVDIDNLKLKMKYVEVVDRYCNTCFNIEDLETLFV
jgi:hypothetical protein